MKTIFYKSEYPKTFAAIEEILGDTRYGSRHPICRWNHLTREEMQQVIAAFVVDTSETDLGELIEGGELIKSIGRFLETNSNALSASVLRTEWLTFLKNKYKQTLDALVIQISDERGDDAANERLLKNADDRIERIKNHFPTQLAA